MVLESHIPDDTNDVGWFRMEKLPGVPLAKSVWENLGPDARVRMLQELKEYLGQLKLLPQVDPGWIGSWNRKPAYDHRLDNRAANGPFASVRDFHDALAAPAYSIDAAEEVTEQRE
ncbi:MAG: hypothetical protein Q9159_005394 [Coniocarpon cinnabarinum]